MNASIISWTNETKSCLSRFSDEIFIKSIAEKHYQYWSNTDHNFKICSIDNAIYEYKIHELDKFIIPCLLRGNTLNAISIYLLLKSYEIPDNDILYVPYNVIKANKIIFVSDLTIFIERKELDRLELHINDHCNLRCANCSMLAGLVHNEVNVDFELTKLSLFKLHNIFNHILEIDIFGGEPFLNPQLSDYCKLLRLIFPNSVIYIVTNGTKICSMNDILLRSIQDNHIRLSITYYPSFDDLIENTIAFCNKNAIEFNILQRRVNFLKLYDFKQPQDSTEIFNLCKRKLSIIAMRENILASCYTPFAFKYAEDEFKIGYKEEGIIDLLKNKMSPKEVITKFLQPMECCKFCHCDSTNWKQVGELYNIYDWSK